MSFSFNGKVTIDNEPKKFKARKIPKFYHQSTASTENVT